MYYVYMLTTVNHSVLYIGVTNTLARRVFEHKTNIGSSFTQKYNVDKLVYYENFDSVEDAIKREKVLKKWNRSWKERLIKEVNPNWDDLYETLNM